jgi:hypothetical protein
MPKRDARIVRMNGIAARVEVVSGQFLGLPYVAHSLIGSPDTPEVLVTSLGGFDCVTYIESVLALVYAEKTGTFNAFLKKIRYAGSKVDWQQRNHYMTQWLHNNVRKGFLERVGHRWATNRKRRLLTAVPGLAPLRQSFSCIPKRRLATIQSEFRSGDLMFFVSTRHHLDVFHCGILIRRDDRLLLRHASRSKGSVVEQDLSSFLDENRMSGVLIARPVDRRRA